MAKSTNPKKILNIRNVDVMYDTINYFKKCINYTGNIHHFQAGVRYPEFSQRKGPKAQLVVEKMDYLRMAKEFISCGTNPISLCFGSKIISTGGAMNGGEGQLESTIRRTNLYFAIKKIEKEMPDVFPLKNVVYCDSIYVLKDENNEILIEPFVTTLIMASAVRFPRVTYYEGEKYFSDKNDILYMKSCINLAFRIAIMKGHDSIVLGAWGCGAYDCPPRHVARMFRRSINRYRNYFKIIGFAINSVNSDHYDIFYEELKDLF